MRKTAGELSKVASSDKTDYNLMELGHAITDEILDELRACRTIYNQKYDEDEYCIVRQCADDFIITNAKRYKYFGYLYLPKPRPDQTVFLYNKKADIIEKRLWTLPSASRMAQLASTSSFVPKEYQEMQAWSVAFFKGTFWDFIRYQNGINMLSESEYISQHRDELIKAGCKLPTLDIVQPLNDAEIAVKAQEVIDSQTVVF